MNNADVRHDDTGPGFVDLQAHSFMSSCVRIARVPGAWTTFIDSFGLAAFEAVTIDAVSPQYVSMSINELLSHRLRHDKQQATLHLLSNSRQSLVRCLAKGVA